MGDADTLTVCSRCGRQGKTGFTDLGSCRSWRACLHRQYENERLRERYMGSIRYSGQTFDRVQRLRKIEKGGDI